MGLYELVTEKTEVKDCKVENQANVKWGGKKKDRLNRMGHITNPCHSKFITSHVFNRYLKVYVNNYWE